MDRYEAFWTEYCALMKKYQEDPTDSEVLAQYTKLSAKGEEVQKEFDAWDTDDLSNEEWLYYLTVYNRVMKMMDDITNE